MFKARTELININFDQRLGEGEISCPNNTFGNVAQHLLIKVLAPVDISDWTLYTAVGFVDLKKVKFPAK